MQYSQMVKWYNSPQLKDYLIAMAARDDLEKKCFTLPDLLFRLRNRGIVEMNFQNLILLCKKPSELNSRTTVAV